MKPGNILLAEDGRARLLDFGIAADLSRASDDLTVDGVVGTLRYLAPERLLGDDATTATDVWGVGVMLFEAAAGRPAFPATTLVERVEAAGRAVERPAGIADATWAVIRRAADGDPARRYHDGAALAAALRDARDVVAGAPIDDAAVTVVIPVVAPAVDAAGVRPRRAAGADDERRRSTGTCGRRSARCACSSPPSAWRRSPSILVSVTTARPGLRPIPRRSPSPRPRARPRRSHRRRHRSTIVQTRSRRRAAAMRKGNGQGQGQGQALTVSRRRRPSGSRPASCGSPRACA